MGSTVLEYSAPRIEASSAPAHTVLEYGIVKSQKLPFSYWGVMRGIETRDQLTAFFREHADFFREFLAKRTSGSKITEIFEGKGIQEEGEFDYLSEATKSAIFRAGGTNIMDWGCWYVGDDVLQAEVISDTDTEQVDVYGVSADIPVKFAVALPKALYDDLKDATSRIHGAIVARAQGCPKIISRVDYVIDKGNRAHIVDIGESNTTLGLADALYRFIGRGEGRLLHEYLDRVIQLQQSIVPGFEHVAFCAEDQKMIENLPYEFNAFERCMMERYRVSAQTITQQDMLHLTGKDKTAFVRCFRGLLHGHQDVTMVDSVKAIPLYHKDTLFGMMDTVTLPPSISLPYHALFPLQHEDTATLAESMHHHAEEKGIQDYVIKPVVKSKKSSSLAFLYATQNGAHVRQLRRTIRKLQEEKHIRQLILEEHMGSGVAQGRKLEVRVHCLSNGYGVR